VVASFAGTSIYAPVTAQNTTVITARTPLVTVTGGTIFFNGLDHPATATVTGVNGVVLATTSSVNITYTLNDEPVAVPNAVGVYQVTAQWTSTNTNYTNGTGAGSLTIVEAPDESCFVVDFREITYFKGANVITSSDAAIRTRNGISGPFNPSLWPYGPTGGGNRTRSRGTLFRIYGFRATEVGFAVPDVDVAGRAYPVVADPQIPGMFYIELGEDGVPAGGHPARVFICPSQLMTDLIDQGQSGLDDPGVLPDTAVLAEANKNVPGILLTRNASVIPVPPRVRTELVQIGTPLVDSLGRPVTQAAVDYIGLQLWGGGAAEYREFVDVEVTFTEDSLADRLRHYAFGFHTAKDVNYEGRGVGCDYVDRQPGRDGIRMNDVWEGSHATDPRWGPACGNREPSQNQKKREDYAVAFNAVQLLPTVNTGSDTVRLHYGTLRPVENRAPSCAAARGPGTLWPPNHKFVDVKIQNVDDPDGDPMTIKITGIMQDEPTLQPGSGNTAIDGKGVGTSTAQVRAERAGTGDGRLYEITFQASDSQGASCTGSIFVGVPHDQGQRDLPVDSGRRYDSTVPGVPPIR